MLIENFWSDIESGKYSGNETHLELLNQNFSDQDVIRLVNAIKTSSLKIKSINLACNNISSEGVKALSSLEDLELLNLSENQIDSTAALYLLNSPIATLDLAFNFEFGNEGVIALSKSNSLKKLYVGGCNITEEGAKEIIGVNNLQLLHLNNNEIGNALCDIAWNTSLKELNLRECGISDAAMGYIANNKSICVLFLDDNRIGDTGVLQLANNKSILKLSLTQTRITGVGLIGLCNNENIQQLSVYGNLIVLKDDNKDLFKDKNQSFTSINLGSNKLDDQSINFLKWIVSFKNLKELYLNQNNLTDNAAKVLCRNKTKVLERLDLTMNKIQHNEFVTLTYNLKRKTIESLSNRDESLQHYLGSNKRNFLT